MAAMADAEEEPQKPADVEVTSIEALAGGCRMEAIGDLLERCNRRKKALFHYVITLYKFYGAAAGGRATSATRPGAII